MICQLIEFFLSCRCFFVTLARMELLCGLIIHYIALIHDIPCHK